MKKEVIGISLFVFAIALLSSSVLAQTIRESFACSDWWSCFISNLRLFFQKPLTISITCPIGYHPESQQYQECSSTLYNKAGWQNCEWIVQSTNPSCLYKDPYCVKCSPDTQPCQPSTSCGNWEVRCPYDRDIKWCSDGCGNTWNERRDCAPIKTCPDWSTIRCENLYNVGQVQIRTCSDGTIEQRPCQGTCVASCNDWTTCITFQDGTQQQTRQCLNSDCSWRTESQSCGGDGTQKLYKCGIFVGEKQEACTCPPNFPACTSDGQPICGYAKNDVAKCYFNPVKVTGGTPTCNLKHEGELCQGGLIAGYHGECCGGLTCDKPSFWSPQGVSLWWMAGIPGIIAGNQIWGQEVAGVCIGTETSNERTETFACPNGQNGWCSIEGYKGMNIPSLTCGAGGDYQMIHSIAIREIYCSDTKCGGIKDVLYCQDLGIGCKDGTKSDITCKIGEKTAVYKECMNNEWKDKTEICSSGNICLPGVGCIPEEKKCSPGEKIRSVCLDEKTVEAEYCNNLGSDTVIQKATCEKGCDSTTGACVTGVIGNGVCESGENCDNAYSDCGGILCPCIEGEYWDKYLKKCREPDPNCKIEGNQLICQLDCDFEYRKCMERGEGLEEEAKCQFEKFKCEIYNIGGAFGGILFIIVILVILSFVMNIFK